MKTTQLQFPVPNGQGPKHMFVCCSPSCLDKNTPPTSPLQDCTGQVSRAGHGERQQLPTDFISVFNDS